MNQQEKGKVLVIGHRCPRDARLSVGLEYVDDIICDLKQALEA